MSVDAERAWHTISPEQRALSSLPRADHGVGDPPVESEE
jgi:hypothetical protein